jgi:DKNYY family
MSRKILLTAGICITAICLVFVAIHYLTYTTVDPRSIDDGYFGGYYKMRAGKVYWDARSFGGEPREVVGADSSTFNTYEHYAWLGVDKNHVYVEDRLVHSADPKTLRVVAATSTSGRLEVWLRDDRHVFKPPWFEVVIGADPDSFDYSFDPYPH